LFAQLLKAIARCSSLDEAGRVMGVEDMDEALVAAELERTFGENPALTPDGEDILGEGVSTCTHYFGSSTITVGKIKEMEKKGYFAKDEAQAPGLKPC
jgi:molybdenum-dependent DNA-binding transcriptional regulator ModE